MRYDKHVILVEGKRLITEALRANIKPLMIMFSRKNLIGDIPLDPYYISPETTVLHKLKYDQITMWSDLTTSPGIFGNFRF